MQRYLITLTLLLVLSSGLPAAAAPNDPVSIPDANLRAKIETLLNKNSGDTITESEMNGITSDLLAGQSSISDLTGLEHATGITVMTFTSNSISDLSPLSGLTQLTHLTISGNPLTDLSALANLTNLTNLYANRSVTQANYDGPNPADLTFLTKLTNLTQLSLDTWAINDISVMANLTKLEDVNLRYNRISDVSPLQNLPKLRILNLYVNRELTDVSPSGSITTLERLNLAFNYNLSNISGLGNLTKLTNLNLIGTNITSAKLSAEFPTLSALNYLLLDGTPISDLSVLSDLPSTPPLTTLSVRYMQDPPLRSRADRSKAYLLKDFTPLVTLMNNGKLTSATHLQATGNWGLDYDSFYTDIPALIAVLGVSSVEHTAGVPSLHRITDERHTGPPQSEHTFRVSAHNTFAEGPVNEAFEGVPVKWKVTAPDMTVTETEVATDADGVSEFTITLGNDGDEHTVEAVVAANTRAANAGPSHSELKVEFTAISYEPLVIKLTLDRETVTQTSLQWIADVSGTLPIAYAYYFKKSTDKDWIRSATTLGRMPRRFGYAHFDLQPGTSYDFQLFALIDGEQFEPGSNVLTAQTLSQTGTIRPTPQPQPDDDTTPQPDPGGDTTSQQDPDADTTPQTTPDGDTTPQPTRVAGTGEAGQIVISEIMFESQGGLRSLPQWIELYNTTDTGINLRGWQLEWYRREPKLLDVTTTFAADFTIPAKAARLVCSTMGRVSGHKELQNRDDQRYLLVRYHSTALDQKDGQNRNRLIARGGFYLKLRDSEDTLIDEIGTVADKTSEPAWELPDSDIDGARSSLIRRFDEGTVRPGTERRGWIRAYDTTARPTGRYYGRATDIGTPAYRSDEMPLPVTLSHFRAEQTDTGVLIKWTTESEVDNAGFYISRSQTKDGKFSVIHPKLIQGAGTTSERTEYTWTDTTARPGTLYYYQIEDISHDGVRERLATVQLRGFVSAAEKRLTKWGALKRTPTF